MAMQVPHVLMVDNVQLGVPKHRVTAMKKKTKEENGVEKVFGSSRVLQGVWSL